MSTDNINTDIDTGNDENGADISLNEIPSTPLSSGPTATTNTSNATRKQRTLTFREIFPKKVDIYFAVLELFNRDVYRNVLSISLFSLIEIILISGIGIGYVVLLSLIPFTNTNTAEADENPTVYFNPYPVASIFFLAMTTVVIVVGAGYFMLLYGFKKSYPLIWITILPGLILSSLFFVLVAENVYPWYYALDLPFYALLGILFYITAFYMSSRVKAANIPRIYSIPLAVHIFIIAIYSFAIFPFYRTIDSEVGRGAIRILVHPILCKINLMVTQRCIKGYKNLRYPHLANGIIFGVLVESALFGRFMIATVGSNKAQVITSVLSGLAEIAVRLSSPIQKRAISYALDKFLKIKSDEETNLDKEHHCAYIINAMVVEKSSIITIPFLLHFFWKHRLVFNFSFENSPPDLDNLVISAAIQLAIDFGTDFICLIGEVIQGLPIVRIFKLKRVKYVIWEIVNWVQMCTLIIYVLRTLPSRLYCDSQDPCTCKLFLQDSLFQMCSSSSLNGSASGGNSPF